MPLNTTVFDPADYLDDDDAVAAYIEEALATDDPSFIARAIGDVARARGMAKIASDTGLARENLYKALSAAGNPEFATVLKVLKALGIRLSVATEQAIRQTK